MTLLRIRTSFRAHRATGKHSVQPTHNKSYQMLRKHQIVYLPKLTTSHPDAILVIEMPTKKAEKLLLLPRGWSCRKLGSDSCMHDLMVA